MNYYKYNSIIIYLTIASALHGGDLVGRIKFASRDVVIAISGVPGRSVAHDSSATMDQRGMRERILPWNGKLFIQANGATSGGTTVKVVLPLPNKVISSEIK